MHERYRVLRRIGRGGMGIVYLAEHVLIGRKYALKTLSERANATDEMVARFHREAVAAASVGSEHVVEVTDMGRLEDGTSFIVMEYLDGIELATAVFSQGRFAAARAVNIACQLCDALTAVHEKGIVHRDLKPENLFLITHNGRADFVKVLDFGVCKLLEGAPDPADPDLPPLTRTNASLGTPQYMAPEQFQNSACVDHRADIHAVGAIVYFMLTGKPPFDAPSLAQLFMRVCVEPPPPLLAVRPDLPAELDAVIRRALAKHPEDRFASGAELKAALLPFSGLASVPVEAAAAPIVITYPTQRASMPETIAESAVALSARSWLPPARPWLRPVLAGGLVAGILTSMVWGAVALGGSSAREAKAPARRAEPRELRSAEVESPVRELAPVQSTAQASPAAGGPQASPAPSSAPQAPKPRLRAPKSAAAEPVSVPPSGGEPLHELAPVQTPAAITDAEPPAHETDTYRFPRRALKDVF